MQPCRGGDATSPAGHVPLSDLIGIAWGP
jgi:hypothetical protein